MPQPRPRARVRARIAAAAAAGVVAAVLACSEERSPRLTGPAASDSAPPTARAPRFGLAAPPGASVRVKVAVPASMRSSPFDVDRYLTLPPDFAVAVYARVSGARFMAAAPNGDLLVSRPGAGKVVRVRPNGAGDPVVTDWATGLRNPHDVVFHTLGGTTYVYVAESHQVDRFVYQPDGSAGARQVVVAGLPDNSSPELQGRYGHQLKNIALDGATLYVSIASPSNADPADVTRTPKGGAVYAYDAATGGPGRLFAQGLRNAEGLAILPGTSTLWVVVNNRDNIAYPYHRDFTGDGQDDYGRVLQSYVDNHPPEEFTRVRDGGNYGWPFCNPNPDAAGGGYAFDDMPFDRDVQNNADGSRLNCDTADRISKGIPAHSAPLGFVFLQATNAPGAYRAGALVGLHGSWNRSSPAGYAVAYFPWDAAAARPGAQQDFVTGWTAGGVWGRPVDVAVDPAGAIYVSDDHSGTIYKLTYAPPAPPPPTGTTGAMKNGTNGGCLSVSTRNASSATYLIVTGCVTGAAYQTWMAPPVGTAGRITLPSGLCLSGTTGAVGASVYSASCVSGSALQQWTHTPAGALRLQNGTCAAALPLSWGVKVVLAACDGSAAQRWTR